ncbi:MAG TPA: glucose 1-dehydrogenase [Isosphaeraceae bacterium]|nr:glucose 1-dehydrogenase [Isosphaeraceae bacterium]
MNPFDLTGKVAIVTGGNGGIGLGMARGLARAGAAVGVLGRNEPKTTEASRAIADEFGVGTLPVLADVTRPDEVERAVVEVADRFGRIDILINNAGINIRKLPDELTLDEWRVILETNLTSVFVVSRAVQPHLKAAGRGKVVNIGSMASVFGTSYAAPYASSKGGVVQLTKSLALAWAPDRINVNAILPGWFDTELTRGARRQFPEMHDRVVARIPLGHWGDPDEIAGAAVWLSSPASDYVTGVALPVDGGFTSCI